MNQTQANRVMVCARRMTAAWNRQQPDRHVSWEVVEEAAVAAIRSGALFGRRGPDQEATEQFARYQSFRARMPEPLARNLFDFEEKGGQA
jgi:endonuclease V-like protein UPF0215 family